MSSQQAASFFVNLYSNEVTINFKLKLFFKLLFNRTLLLLFIFMVRGLSLGVFQGFFVYAPEVSASQLDLHFIVDRNDSI